MSAGDLVALAVGAEGDADEAIGTDLTVPLLMLAVVIFVAEEGGGGGDLIALVAVAAVGVAIPRVEEGVDEAVAADLTALLLLAVLTGVVNAARVVAG